MNYAEATYFDGAHFAHVAAWYERRRQDYIATRNARALAIAERMRSKR